LLPLTTTAEFTRKDGSFFTVVDEAVAEELPLETRFPGARIVRAVPPPASGDHRLEPQPSVTLPAIAVPPLADEWRVVLVLGRTGSGKSRALATLGSALGGAAWVPSWEAQQAVVSQFGGGEAAVRWLGAVGLNALPLWCAPFHTLSTGEGARAVLARQLQRAEQTASPLLVDNFGQVLASTHPPPHPHPSPPPLPRTNRHLRPHSHLQPHPHSHRHLRPPPDPRQALDQLSAACCAAALARLLRRSGTTRALLATNEPRLVHWLQPDAVLLCESGAPPVWLTNACTATPLPLRIVCDDEAREGGGGGGGGGGVGSEGGDDVQAEMEVEAEAEAPRSARQLQRVKKGAQKIVKKRKTPTPVLEAEVQAQVEAQEEAEVVGSGGGGELFLWHLERCGLQPQQVSKEAEEAAVAGGGESGGVVLCAAVQTSDETNMCAARLPPARRCRLGPPTPAHPPLKAARARSPPRVPSRCRCDALFDLPFGGVCARALPRFPTSARLRPFRLGFITGPSGAAKSALLREHFGSPRRFHWDAPRTVAAHLGVHAARYVAAAALGAGAAGSEFAALSGGEQAQAEVARALWWCEEGCLKEDTQLEGGAREEDGPREGCEGGGGEPRIDTGASGGAASGRQPARESLPGRERLLLLDEFGSSWDVDTASRVAAALAAAVRDPCARVAGAVLASCHLGFVAALQPDWVFEAASATLLQPASPPHASWVGAPSAELPPSEEEEGSGDCGGGGGCAGGAAPTPLSNLPRGATATEAATDMPPLSLLALGGGMEAWEVAAHRAAAARPASGAASVVVATPQLDLRMRRCGGAEWHRFSALHYKSAALSTHAAMRAHLLTARLGEGPEVHSIVQLVERERWH